MALETVAFHALCDILRQIQHRPVTMLCLGYPDLLVKEDDLRGRLPEPDAFIRPASEERQIAQWHNWPYRVYDTAEVLELLGVKPVFVDIYPSRGVETHVDLNEPFFEPYEYDIVFDGGTLEHCFNIGQAFINVAQSVKPGGFAVHMNPMSQINHGFWNINPTAYIDFYTQNGFDVLKLDAVVGPPSLAKHENLQTTDRVQIRPEVRSLVVAQRTHSAGFGYPTQTKYLRNRELKA